MITIVVAMGKNREIGVDNQLLWHLPKDLKHFKELTSGTQLLWAEKPTKVLVNRFLIALIL